MSEDMEAMQHPWGQLYLQRAGGRDPVLRAWDAADEYLLASLKASGAVLGRIAVLEDAQGALALALVLAGQNVVSFGDLASARDGLAHNAGINGLLLPAWQALKAGPGQMFDTIIIKLPRQLAYLEYLLCWANDHLADAGVIWMGGMIKHLPDRCAETCARLVVPQAVLPAWRKARVIRAVKGLAGLAGGNWLQGYPVEELGIRVNGLPNVFSRDRLDGGSRLLLSHLTASSEPLRILDLGCGNGLLGLMAGQCMPQAHLCFSDVSAQAVASAQANWAQCYGQRQALFFHWDGVPDLAPGSVDRIFCNPPFHEQGTVGDHIAWRMFTQVRPLLAPGGCMLVVGNRHLGYHVKLKRLFPQVQQLAADKRFVVLAVRGR